MTIRSKVLGYLVGSLAHELNQQRDELAHLSRVAMLGEFLGNAQAAQRFLAHTSKISAKRICCCSPVCNSPVSRENTAALF